MIEASVFSSLDTAGQVVNTTLQVVLFVLNFFFPIFFGNFHQKHGRSPPKHGLFCQQKTGFRQNNIFGSTSVGLTPRPKRNRDGEGGMKSSVIFFVARDFFMEKHSRKVRSQN